MSTVAPVVIRSRLRELADVVVGPVEDGYLRPWMCAGDPAAARVFLVGANPATPFPIGAIDRESYLDALVSDGDRLRELYLRVRGGSPSPTRRHIDHVVALLAHHGVTPVLETNVWTLPTRDLASLRRADKVVVDRSSMVIVALMKLLEPQAVVVHGAEATRTLGQLLGRSLEPAEPSRPVRWYEGTPPAVAIPSLSPPRANAWLQRSTDDLHLMAEALRRAITTSRVDHRRAKTLVPNAQDAP